MRKNILPILVLAALAACNNSGKKKSEIINTNNKKENLARELGCPDDPDTSLGKMDLRTPGSVQAVIPDDSKPDSLGQYHFYSNKQQETLTLIQHPGDDGFNISIFKVEWSNKADYRYERLEDTGFITGKGIKRGMSKEEVVSKIGKCYTAKDSADGYIELYYRLESPNDTRNGLLSRNNMPIYSASYKFWKNKLGKFEFGFEYP